MSISLHSCAHMSTSDSARARRTLQSRRRYLARAVAQAASRAHRDVRTYQGWEDRPADLLQSRTGGVQAAVLLCSESIGSLFYS